MTDPDDQPFVDSLRSITPDAWEELWQAVDAVAAQTDYATWEGGETREGRDGRPVTTMPYPAYHPSVDRLRSAIGSADLMVPFEWPDWADLPHYRDDPTRLADAPVADAVRMITAILRSERFTDGSIEGALESGLLLAALARVRTWAAEQGLPT